MIKLKPTFLKVARESKDLTQAEMGKLLKVDTQFVSNIERGISAIPAKYFPVINKHLGVPILKMENYMIERYRLRMRSEYRKQA